MFYMNSIDLKTLVANRIFDARRDASAIAPVRDLWAAPTLTDAYGVQRINKERRSVAGGRTVGRKIGLTSEAVQQQLGVDAPDSGWLWADTGFAGGAAIAHSALIAPRIEAEIAFVLGADIADPDAPIGVIAEAVAWVAPALEIVDSAIADWNITLIDTVADNASGWGFVLGDLQRCPSELSLAALLMILKRNGHVESRGVGSATMGDPLNALAWLARHAIAMGEPLCAGEIVLSGALGPVLTANAGDCFETLIDGFEPLCVRFV